ncbi:4'-phosphopantetheinyl transferase superfamily protein [Streptomyces sp. NPDC048357]|uniref:4'-phosphopantetheinyl transferase family protein n=1 Tax=Streptomyces sp. NPDC048357 TaxID=3154719 RepID=UPI0034347DEA
MIAPLLPPEMAYAEEFGDPPGGFLFPEEAAFVQRSVPVRRQEFTTVRMCARRALATLGVAPEPLLPGHRGAPRWPEGIVGSMTHCTGYRAAALARRHRIAAVGIDAEPALPLPAGLLEAIALPAERSHVRSLSRSSPTGVWDRLLFCAKESVYKAVFPLTGVQLRFSDAAITFDPAGGTFHARLLVPGITADTGDRAALDGKWTTSGGLLLTSVVVTAGDRTRPTDPPRRH